MDLDLQILNELNQLFIAYAPKFVGGLIFIIACFIVYKLVLYIVKKILKISRLNALNGKLNNNDILKKSSITLNLENIILQVVKWFLILIILIVGADFFGLTIVSQQISNLIAYLPQLISAILIFVLGFYFASKIKDMLQTILKSMDIKGSNIISNIAFYFIIIFIIITALNQAGVNTDIITNNLTIILGAILLTFTIGFGLGSRKIIHLLLLGFYTNKNFAVGQRIKYRDVEGTIIAINNITLTLKTKNETILIPIEKMNNEEITIVI